MYIVDLWIEHRIRSIDKTFTYLSEEEVFPLCRVCVPFHSQKEVVGFVKQCTYTEKSLHELEQEAGYAFKFITRIMDTEPLLTPELEDVALWMKEQTLSTTIACFQSMLPSVIKPGTSKAKAVQEKWVKVTGKQISMTPKQLQAYTYVRTREEVLYSELRKLYPNIARVLVEKGLLSTFSKDKQAKSNAHISTEQEKQLTSAQKSAFEAILNDPHDVILLRGVTGSGKTEIFLQLASRQLAEGKQVLLLVPEIALTPQMIERVQNRFGHELAMYHSALSPQEKYEQYLKVRNGQARIVVGTRSAVFLPFTDLGLIVMDEEHETSYKQDKQPSYHCRDVAIYRAGYHHCKVLLASATPSLDSYARSKKGVYGLVEMIERVNQSLPEITIVNTRDEIQQNGNVILSEVLKKKLQERLDKKESSILLLNRRGYISILRCKSCEDSIQCPHCEVAMSYHRDIHRLKCHTCGFEMNVPKECPTCHSTQGYTTLGYGTERLEEELHATFPGITTLRMDKDTTTRKNSYENIFKTFAQGGIDVLLGTQMIAKGLDFPQVTLVGILQGDAGIQRIDFRSCETTFDLLTQASGRSGRSDRKGEVVFQVLHPEHYAVQCAALQDYPSFFKKEMQYRHEGQYPPYTYLISVMVQHRDENTALKIAMDIKQNVTGSFKTIGIVQLLKLRDLSRFRILLKGKDLEEMRRSLRGWLDSKKSIETNAVIIDVNPMTLD